MKVSVVIPVYNVEKYLSRCLDSVLNQTLKEIEIICVNDCSTDNSFDILTKYHKKDSRIHVIDNKKNQGVAITRNIGLKQIHGEYVFFMDSDDWVSPDFLEKLYNKARKTNADIVMGTLIEVDYDGHSVVRQEAKLLYDTKDKFYACTDFKPAIYKRSLIDQNKLEFPAGVILCEDMLFLTKILILAKIVEVVLGAKYYYCRRIDSGNSQVLVTKQIDSALPILSQMGKIFNGCPYCDGQRFAYMNILNILIAFMQKTQIEDAKKCARLFYELYGQYSYKDKLPLPHFIEIFSKFSDDIRVKKLLFFFGPPREKKRVNT